MPAGELQVRAAIFYRLTRPEAPMTMAMPSIFPGFGILRAWFVVQQVHLYIRRAKQRRQTRLFETLLELMKMKYTIPNTFIAHECQRLSIDQAPIDTSIQETYSQCNEDLIIEAMLRAIMLRSGREMQSVRYMEIGANHPVQTSATYLLSKNHGAKGVLVEAIPKLAARLEKVRPNDLVFNCAITTSNDDTVEFYVHEKDELSSVSVKHISKFTQFGGEQRIVEKLTVPNIHINDLMRNHGANLDFLSIDVEGLDADLIAAMDTVFQPSIIQCEHGGKIDEFYHLLLARDYVFAGITDVNLIAVKRGVI